MSDYTPANTGFESAIAQDLPTLFCTGVVSDIEDPYFKAESGNWVSKITIKGTRDANTWLVFQPEWFTPGFKVSSLQSRPESMRAYGRNIYNTDQMTTLFGLMGGNKEKLSAFSQYRDQAYQGKDFTPEEIVQLLRDFLGEAGSEVYYSMTQQVDRGVDENGDKTAVKRERYQLGRFYAVTDRTLGYFNEKAATEPDKYRVTFE